MTYDRQIVSLQRQDALEGLRSLPDGSVDLIVADPPYSGMNQHLKLGKGRIVGDYTQAGTDEGDWFTEWSDDADTYEAFLKECHRVMRNDRHIFIMFDPYSLLSLAPVVRSIFAVKNLITWDKVNIGMGHYFRRRSEFILFASKGKQPLTAKNIPDIWQIKRINRPKYPTQKPVALFRQMIDASLDPNSNAHIVDPFFGSGSSAIAALQAGHSYTGFDISQQACEYADERLMEHGLLTSVV